MSSAVRLAHENGVSFVTLKMAQSSTGRSPRRGGVEMDHGPGGAGSSIRCGPRQTPSWWGRGRSSGTILPFFLETLVGGTAAAPALLWTEIFPSPPGAKMLADGLGPVVIACRRDASPSDGGGWRSEAPRSRHFLRRGANRPPAVDGGVGSPGVMSILAEGGGDLAASLLAAGVVREVAFFRRAGCHRRGRFYRKRWRRVTPAAERGDQAGSYERRESRKRYSDSG